MVRPNLLTYNVPSKGFLNRNIAFRIAPKLSVILLLNNLENNTVGILFPQLVSPWNSFAFNLPLSGFSGQDTETSLVSALRLSVVQGLNNPDDITA